MELIANNDIQWRIEDGLMIVVALLSRTIQFGTVKLNIVFSCGLYEVVFNCS